MKNWRQKTEKKTKTVKYTPRRALPSSCALKPTVLSCFRPQMRSDAPKARSSDTWAQIWRTTHFKCLSPLTSNQTSWKYYKPSHHTQRVEVWSQENFPAHSETGSVWREGQRPLGASTLPPQSMHLQKADKNRNFIYDSVWKGFPGETQNVCFSLCLYKTLPLGWKWFWSMKPLL